MTNLVRVLQSRDLSSSTNARIVKSMVFPVVLYRYESWTIKKSDAEELVLLNCGAGEEF